ncbi:hypothetical protein [Aliiglaciecola sp. LCG003]|uniref:hypothetical protein n=1 Tax=Aliiglaciecola sp. LCG003 TaxID=3053655 RepID=UPI002573DF27|nr:hypothetical protein [Aliiglaciecola sp. LCG003]WJG10439.1 hypothetical protein QR722_05200 [Aliiglaciecola sp. LCG003]
MRRFKAVTQSGSQLIERGKNRRQAYFPGKYIKESLMFLGVLFIISALYYY